MKKFIQIVPFYPLPLAIHDKEDYFLVPAEVMKEKGFEAEFVTLIEKGSKMVELSQLEKRTSKKEFYKGFKILRFQNTFKLLSYINKQKGAIIHSHMRSFLPSILAGLLPNRKVMSSFTYVMGSNRLIAQTTPFFFNRFSLVRAVTPFEINVYIKSGVKKEKIRLVPLSIDYPFYSKRVDTSNTRKKYGISKKDMLITAVANVRRHKRYDVLLKAFKIVKMRKKNVKLIIVGDDFLKEQGFPSIVEMARELGIERDVTLTGFVDSGEVRKIYSLTNVFVHTAENEYQGLVSYEAAAMKIPLCLSNIGSQTSVFKENALYHDIEDHVTLANNIISSLNPSEEMKKRINFLHNYVKNWDYKIIKKKLSKMYDEIIS